MSSNSETVEQAIAQRRRVMIRYRGQGRARVVEPHLLYRTPSGRRTLVAYQVRGYSAGGRPPPFWRPFRLSRIDEIYPLPEDFEPRVERGFATVAALVRGEVLATVAEADVTLPGSDDSPGGEPGDGEQPCRDAGPACQGPPQTSPSTFTWSRGTPVMRVMRAIRSGIG